MGLRTFYFCSLGCDILRMSQIDLRAEKRSKMLYRTKQLVRLHRENISGLTLLELVAGVSVLVAMAGISLEFLDRFNQESAYRVTIERLEIIKKALHEYSADTVVNRRGNNGNETSSIGAGRNWVDMEDLGIIHNDSVPNSTPIGNGVNLHSITVANTVGANLNSYLPGWGSFGGSLPDPRVPGYEVYFDGWGNPFRYRNALPMNFDVVTIGNILADAQATAYVWSSGQDGTTSNWTIDSNGRLVRDGNGNVVNLNDDIIYTLDFSAEFDTEAQRRVDEINAALRRYISAGNPLLDDPPATPIDTFFSWIISPLVSGGYLPNDNRYLFNPWRFKLHGAHVSYYGGHSSNPLACGNASLAGSSHTFVIAGGLLPCAEVTFLKSRSP